MNELRPKDPPKEEQPNNEILESGEPQKDMIDTDVVNQMGFMNTNGAEISHILKNPNDMSHNLTNLDILDMPSGKTNVDQEEPGQISQPISEKVLPHAQSNVDTPQPDLGFDDPFGDFTKNNQSAPKPQENEQQVVNNPSESQTTPVEKPEVNGDVKETEAVMESQGGFDDIFDDKLGMENNDPKPQVEDSLKTGDQTNNQENNLKFDDPMVVDKEPANEGLSDPVENLGNNAGFDDPLGFHIKEEPQKKNTQEATKTEKNPKKLDMKKSDEFSGDDQYYSPDYYQDTGGYEDDGGDNYFQNNYYGDGSDYDEEDDKDYETYKRDETVKEGKPAEKKGKDAADFL